MMAFVINASFARRAPVACGAMMATCAAWALVGCVGSSNPAACSGPCPQGSHCNTDSHQCELDTVDGSSSSAASSSSTSGATSGASSGGSSSTGNSGSASSGSGGGSSGQASSGSGGTGSSSGGGSSSAMSDVTVMGGFVPARTRAGTGVRVEGRLQAWQPVRAQAGGVTIEGAFQ